MRMEGEMHGKLIYSMLMSLDGYTEDEHGDFGWGAPEDEEVHSYVNELASSVGTYLYGRRMYETMVLQRRARSGADPRDIDREGKRQSGPDRAGGIRTNIRTVESCIDVIRSLRQLEASPHRS